jgi:hypothetical protein
MLSMDGLFEWKTQVTMSGAQILLVAAALWTITAAVGHRAPIERSTQVFLFTALGVVLYLVNGYAEKRLLSRFKNDFFRLGRTGRITTTVCVLLMLVLIAVAAAAAATAVRRLPHSY